MHGPFADFADGGVDLDGFDAAFRQGNRAVDVGLGHRPAGMGLEGDVLHQLAPTQPIEQLREIRWRKRVEEAMLARKRGPRNPPHPISAARIPAK